MGSFSGPRLVVITGCDSGIGAELCRQYIERGYTVAAGYLGQLPAPLSARHRTLPLDLRSQESIGSFALSVLALLSTGASLHAVVSNAGIVIAGPVESIPLDAVRETFEVNFFGAYALIQRLIPSIIEARARIVLVGSLAGLVAMPFFSPYVSSKFALEGFADSLRRELNPFGVKTIIFEPAAVATPIWDGSWERIRERYLGMVSERYRAVFEDIGGNFVRGGNAGLATEAAAGEMIKAIGKRRPRARYLVSKSPFISALEAFLPDGVIDALIARVCGMDRLAGKGAKVL
ncbi:MAG TPA: SDR family NAD(P)-dependent oxidoreductase [Treponemataceae bacterium]|nr:SDR family NAD(P)-dependent oxidoreductase [Treponemataceae bacterium]HPS44171.1 SDR family NAD(P)-dependent oxidoreductase [Treponemataceae bacterium]